MPAIPGCYALMATREEALAELGRVFEMIAEEYVERGMPLPEDMTGRECLVPPRRSSSGWPAGPGSRGVDRPEARSDGTTPMAAP